MNLRIIFILLGILGLNTIGYGQRWKLVRYEAHFGIGTTNVFGKIGGTASSDNLYGIKDIKIGETGPSFYLGARYKLTEETSLKLNLIFGHASGSDAGSKNATRGYSYSTTLFEPSLQFEYYFLQEERRYRPSNLFNRRGMINNYSLISAYGFLGAGGLFFSPKLSYDPAKFKPGIETISGYSKTSGVIALGAGVKMAIDQDWSIGFEFGRRFTFTDYLEGINTTYSKSKDVYYFGVFHAIYKLATDRRGIPVIFSRRKY